MSFFKDSKFEELDWISQAVEPINSQLNDVLKSLPDSFIIDFKTFFSIMKANGWWDRGINIDATIDFIISDFIDEYIFNNKTHLAKCFKFEIVGQPTINCLKQSIDNGTITLTKIQTTLDEKVLKNILGQNGINRLWQLESNDVLALSRANEIMDLLGSCEKGIRSRSMRGKRNTISLRVKDIFSNNEWNIKDTELANKVGYWIVEYVQKNNLSAFANFCKLKVMTHKGAPIYSMEEVV